MIRNPYNLTSYATREEINDDVDEMHVKKRFLLGFRLGHLKHHEHVKKAEEELAQMQPAPLVRDDYTL